MGVCAGNVLGLIVGVDFWGIGTFLGVVILEGVGYNDFVTGGGAIVCFMANEEVGGEEEGSAV